MLFDGIGFNSQWVASLSQSDFLKEAEVNTHWFKGDEKREAKLKEVHKLCKQKHKKIEKPNS